MKYAALTLLLLACTLLFAKTVLQTEGQARQLYNQHYETLSFPLLCSYTLPEGSQIVRTDVLDFDGDNTNDLIVYARQGSTSYINCITPNGEMLWSTSDTSAGNGFSNDKALLRCNNTTMLLTASYSTAQVQFTLSNPISGAVLADTTVSIDEGVPNGSDDFIGPFQFASFNPAQCMYWCYHYIENMSTDYVESSVAYELTVQNQRLIATKSVYAGGVYAQLGLYYSNRCSDPDGCDMYTEISLGNLSDGHTLLSFSGYPDWTIPDFRLLSSVKANNPSLGATLLTKD